MPSLQMFAAQRIASIPRAVSRGPTLHRVVWVPSHFRVALSTGEMLCPSAINGLIDAMTGRITSMRMTKPTFFIVTSST